MSQTPAEELSNLSDSKESSRLKQYDRKPLKSHILSDTDKDERI